MKQINLRDYYPHYKEDKIVEVPDEVAALLEDLDRKEESYLRYLRRYGAFFTFDLGDIKEKDMPFQKSPIDILEQQRTLSLLYQGLAKLPKKQGRRIYAHIKLYLRPFSLIMLFLQMRELNTFFIKRQC